MDRKVSKTRTLCNKNAPKELDSGTPKASNHLVRTERRVHIEIVPSSMGRILLQTPGIPTIFSTFIACFILVLSAWPHICPQTEKNRGTLDFTLQSPSAHINQLAFPTAASPFQRRSLLSSGDHLLQQPLTVLSSFGVNVAGLLFTVRSASENGQ